MSKEEERDILLRSYSTVWSYETKLYSIDKLRLWIPVAINDLLFFVLGLILAIVLSKLLPFFSMIPWIFRYAGLPFLVMKFFTKMKFDGKAPHKFALGCIEYFMLPDLVSRFSPCTKYPKGRFQNVLYREAEIINIIDIQLRERNKRRRKNEL